MKKSIEVSEESLMECKLSLVDLFEDAEQDYKDDIPLMLLVDKDDAYGCLIEVLEKRFSEVFSDAEIEAHIISEREDLALERHLEEAYDYE